MSQKLHLDIHKLEFDREGAKGFVWPFPYAEREKFANFVLQSIQDYVREYEGDNILPYKLALKYFLADVVSVFWADALKQEFERKNITPIPDVLSKYWVPLFEGRAPEKLTYVDALRLIPSDKKQSGVTQKLERMFQKVMKLFKLASIQKGGVNVDGLKLKPLSKKVLQNDIIATQRISTLIQHAKTVHQDVTYVPSGKWFSVVHDEEMKKSLDLNDNGIIQDLMGVVKRGYELLNIECPQHSYQHIQSVLEHVSAVLRVHYDRLIANPEKLPQHIWTGTGGNVWDLMLRLAALENGGKAAGHDHGAGLAHVDYQLMGFVEFWGCDEFLTFNKGQAAELSKHAQSWKGMQDRVPDIKSALPSDGKPGIQIYPHHIEKIKEIKTIMVMTEIYDGDRGRPSPSCPDIIQADWQARIVPRLNDWDYDVIMKLHPESPIMPPDVFEKQMRARIETERLEHVLNEADVIIFDCLYSTSIRLAIETNIPFVLIDFYDHPWTKTGKELIQKRASFVRGCFDEQGRRSVDWGDLEQAIKDAPLKRNNTEFFEYYYGAE